MNERTFELERKADMLFARCAHQLAHVCRKSEHSTKDLIYAVGSKYPNESARTCDVISYEPDFIMSGTKNRLHYFDEEAKQLFVHELSTQTTACVAYRAAEPLPSEFSSVHA